MYTPTADTAARAFELGRPVGELIHVRRGDTDTWRLDTTTGSYFLKGYYSSTGGQFAAGGLIDQLEVAMAFERRALAAGVDMPAPIPPTDPYLGWLTRIEGRLFRAYPWIDHREFRGGEDLADWLGRTMAQVHQLQPMTEVGLPAWWRTPIHPRATWEEWIAEAKQRGKYWADLARDRLPYLLDISSRIEALCESAPDRVTTHGDFKTHNLLMTPTGQVLVDWDSVRVDSAALEAGRVAHIFGAGEREPTARILTAYTAAGGNLTWAGQNLFLSVERHDLHVLYERILVALNHLPAPHWMGTDQQVEQGITKLLNDLPAKTNHLSDLASTLIPH